MQQYSKVVELLQQAYIAGAGNPDIGPADGRIIRIGSIIVELGGPQALFQAQREGEAVREDAPVEKKSPMMRSERKPSASLIDANPVLSNQSEFRGVAGNPEKEYSSALDVQLDDTAMANIAKNLQVGKDFTKGGFTGNAKEVELSPVELEILNNKTKQETRIANRMLSEEMEARRSGGGMSEKDLSERIDKAMELTETPGELAMLENEYAENTRLLTEADYKGKTPMYVSKEYSAQQIDATLTSLGIEFPADASIKWKAKKLIESSEEK